MPHNILTTNETIPKIISVYYQFYKNMQIGIKYDILFFLKSSKVWLATRGFGNGRRKKNDSASNAAGRRNVFKRRKSMQSLAF